MPRSTRCATRQRRNMIATLVFSQGTQMLLMGDERGRTQDGKTTPIASPARSTGRTGTRRRRTSSSRTFVRRVIAIRSNHALFLAERYFHAGPDARRNRFAKWLRPERRGDDRRDWEKGGKAARWACFCTRRRPSFSCDERLRYRPRLHPAGRPGSRLVARRGHRARHRRPKGRRRVEGGSTELPARSLLLLETQRGRMRRAAPGVRSRWAAARWRFRLWAPGVPALKLRLSGARCRWRGAGAAGSRWRPKPGEGRALRLRPARWPGRFPTPASRRQEGDVHGASLLTAPRHPVPWEGRPWEETVLLRTARPHLSTPEGTYRAAIGEFDRLAALGFTAIEIMPVARFGGDRGWGYDGGAAYFPARRLRQPPTTSPR